MISDPMFWLALASKMAIVGALVVVASWTAERSGPLVGAMVATLPISAAPAYLFVSLDHDSSFIAASAIGSLGGNAANIVFCSIYTLVAQRRGLAVSLAVALASWSVMAALTRSVEWTVAGAVVLN